MSNQEVANWISKIPSTFSDPLRNIRPKNERELTGVLAIRHHFGKIDWDKVKLFNIHTDKNDSWANKEILSSDIVLAEYPLFSSSEIETSRWGGMMPDLLFTDKEKSHLALVEAKVDSNFTFSNNPPGGQISRYLEYLETFKKNKKSLIVITPRFNKDWYYTRIKNTIEHSQSSIPTYIMEWEDIFDANRG